LTTTNEYDNPWIFNDKPFNSEDIKDFVGFVYIIECLLNDKKYIGRKYFYNVRKVKGKTRRVRSESDWKKYYGSSQELKKLVDDHGKENFRRIILSLHTTTGDCNYEETKVQFKLDVLERDDFLNDNINGKWHRKPQHIIDGRLINESYKVT
jgi:ribosome maturation factor RimP